MDARCVAFLVAITCAVAKAFNAVEIPRVSISDYQVRLGSDERETPCIVEGVMSRTECETMCNHLMSKQVDVTMQRKRPDSNSQHYHLDIRKAIDLLMFQSSHDDALFCFEEGLVGKHLPTMSKELLEIRESVFGNDDLFQYFPEWARPTDCVVLAGEGATSTLHRDPFEWTGTSLCLEGTKLWRFVEPNSSVQEIDTMLQSYRLPSTAWDDDIVLSAGWQSDFSLYKTRNDKIASGREWSDVSDRENKMLEIGKSHVMLCPDVSLDKSNVWTTVQSEGDLLVIPAHWWHQTYAFEPSIAIASQRCSGKEAERVLQHMLDTAHLDSVDTDIVKKTLDRGSPKDLVKYFFTQLEGALS